MFAVPVAYVCRPLVRHEVAWVKYLGSEGADARSGQHRSYGSVYRCNALRASIPAIATRTRFSCYSSSPARDYSSRPRRYVSNSSMRP